VKFFMSQPGALNSNLPIQESRLICPLARRVRKQGSMHCKQFWSRYRCRYPQLVWRNMLIVTKLFLFQVLNFFRNRNQSSMTTRPHIPEIKSPLTDECSTRDATNLILPLRVALYPGFRPPNRPKLKDMQDAALYPFYDRNNCPISSPPQREHPQTAKELRPNKTLKLQHA
jgi:hypothetical protein